MAVLKGFQPIFDSDIPVWAQVQSQEPMEHREKTNKRGGARIGQTRNLEAKRRIKKK